jgi:peptide/nickel transport system substrate-binding protein
MIVEKNLEKQIEELTRRARPSRREFIQLAMAAGLSAGAAQSLFSSRARAEPKAGGSFKIGIGDGSTTDTLDPGSWNNALTFLFGQAFFGACLVEIDQKNAVKPNLAESIEPADGATKWIFKLRRGLTFHNGKPLTSTDVVETYNYHRGENSKSAGKGLLAGVADVKADGPEAVIVTLKSGNADFPYVLSDYHLPISPAKEGGGIEWEKGVGCGPFILKSFAPGVSVVGTRNPNYHKTGLPYFDEVTILSIIDVAARSNALTTGDIHFMDRCDLKTIDLLKNNPEIEVDTNTTTFQYHALMNVTVPPFDNADVRLALKWSLDRQELVKKAVFGYGIPGNDNPIAPNTKFAINPEPIYRHDPERVKFHLKKAGLSSLKVDFSTSEAAFPTAVDTALLMQAQAAKAGIDINVVREASDGYWDNIWMKKAFCMSYWGGRPTCDYAFTSQYTDDAKWNDTYWINKRFNELVRAARPETDEQKRQALYAEAQQIIHDDGGLILLMFPEVVEAHSKAVAHGEVNRNFGTDGGRILERWWFA